MAFHLRLFNACFVCDLQGSIPKTQGNALPGITNPGVVTILLRLLLGCDDAAERTTTLGALRRVIGGSARMQPSSHAARQPSMHVLQNVHWTEPS